MENDHRKFDCLVQARTKGESDFKNRCASTDVTPSRWRYVIISGLQHKRAWKTAWLPQNSIKYFDMPGTVVHCAIRILYATRVQLHDREI
jgi:hypothetical protein